jgi:hypothetical protein
VTWLAYSTLAYLFLATVRLFRADDVWSVYLAGAVYGWLTEGGLIHTLYGTEESAPFPISLIITGVSWHALISVLVGWYAHGQGPGFAATGTDRRHRVGRRDLLGVLGDLPVAGDASGGHPRPGVFRLRHPDEPDARRRVVGESACGMEPVPAGMGWGEPMPADPRGLLRPACPAAWVAGRW